jgi:SAM-dependent methyltransferase
MVQNPPRTINRYVLGLISQKEEVNGIYYLLKGDVLHLPFKEGAFDKVICSEVLEHLLDDCRGLKELVRVLKGGGIMAISVPAYFMESLCWLVSRDYYGFPGGHIRKYKIKELKRLVKACGLKIYAVRCRHAFHSFYWLLRCLCGVRREKAFIPSLYYKFLVWDLSSRNPFFQLIEYLLNFICAKSIVIYTRKPV